MAVEGGELGGCFCGAEEAADPLGWLSGEATGWKIGEVIKVSRFVGWVVVDVG
jgi:hypothetical protein